MPTANTTPADLPIFDGPDIDQDPTLDLWNTPASVSQTDNTFAETHGITMPSSLNNSYTQTTILRWDQHTPEFLAKAKKRGWPLYVLIYAFPEKDDLGLTYVREERVFVSASTRQLDQHIDRYRLMSRNGDAKIVPYDSL